MKLKVILILSSFFICCKSVAQGEQWGIQGSQLNYIQNNETSHVFTFTTYFSFGAPDSCPAFNYSISFLGTTMYVKGFYNVCGIWPQLGCVRSNTVNYNNAIPDDIQYIIMSTNAITSCETGNPVTVENIYSNTYDVDLGTDTFSDNAITIFPNPVQDILRIDNKSNEVLEKIIITDCLGKSVLEINQNLLEIDLSRLSSGLYFVQCFIKGKRSQLKFIKT